MFPEEPPQSSHPPYRERLLSENPVPNSISTASDISRSSTSTPPPECQDRARIRQATTESEEKENALRKIYRFRHDVGSLSFPNAVPETPSQHEKVFKQKTFEYEERQMDSKCCDKCSGFGCEKFNGLISHIEGKDKKSKKNRHGGSEDLGAVVELQREDSMGSRDGDDEKSRSMNIAEEWEFIDAHSEALSTEGSNNESKDIGISVIGQVGSCDQDQREAILESNEGSGVNDMESYGVTRSPRWKKAEHRAGITSFPKEDGGNSSNHQGRFGPQGHASTKNTFPKSKRFLHQKSQVSRRLPQRTNGSNPNPFLPYQPYSMLPNGPPPQCRCQFHRTPSEEKPTTRHTIYGYDLPSYPLPQIYTLTSPTKSLVVDHNRGVWYLFSPILPSHPFSPNPGPPTCVANHLYKPITAERRAWLQFKEYPDVATALIAKYLGAFPWLKSSGIDGRDVAQELELKIYQHCRWLDEQFWDLLGGELDDNDILIFEGGIHVTPPESSPHLFYDLRAQSQGSNAYPLKIRFHRTDGRAVRAITRKYLAFFPWMADDLVLEKVRKDVEWFHERARRVKRGEVIGVWEQDLISFGWAWEWDDTIGVREEGNP
ncbi:hypothetical protein B7494_g2450 [Chlorociboria aeruginascens]|nr:hypothetical protein B7494_g2450 [Chlorociboria aeruginascens]